MADLFSFIAFFKCQLNLKINKFKIKKKIFFNGRKYQNKNLVKS